MQYNRLPERQTGLVFDKRQTNIAKGVAVLLLLWHHLFYDSTECYERFTTLYLFRNIPFECYIAPFCSVCVSMFLILSGYGLYLSWRKQEEKTTGGKLTFRDQVLFVKNHLLKLMFGYWFIYLLFVPIGIFFDRPFWEIYEGSIVNGIIDFFGFADLFETPTMNATWWFMSLIILLYLLFPLFVRIQKWSSEILLCLAFFLLIWKNVRGLNFSHRPPNIPYFGKYFVWVLPFVIGLYLAKHGLLERVYQRNKSWIKSLVLTGLLVLFSFLIIILINERIRVDTLFAVSIILFSFMVLSRIKFINTVLEQFGKYSGAIFMLHTFIYSYYFRDFIYSFKYAPIILAVLTAICYAVAYGLDRLKVLIRYDKLCRLCIGNGLKKE